MQKLKAFAMAVALVWVLPLAGFAAETTAAATPVPAIATSATTLGNLLTLYSAESNAQSKYLAFAEKAKAEGYLRVARLFRATAMSQGFHAAGHAKLIKSLGGIPKADMQTPKVGSTKENLEAALSWEKNIVEKVCPAFAKQAELEKNIQAQRVFGGKQVVESNSIKWFSQALAELPAWKADGDFFVCKVCGNLAAKLDFEYCPVCKAPVSEYQKVM